MRVDSLKIEKGYATSDERHRFVVYGNMEIPWKLNISPIWSLSSSIPENLDVPLLGDGRLPNIPRNALGRQIQNGAQLNAAITSMLAPSGLLTGAQSATQSTITDMNTQIAAMQAQLNQEQTQLITQYSQLNASLVTAQQQQAALASALASLP